MDRLKGNFMSKFTDLNSRALKHLTSQQFFEVWNNYDQDGNGYIEGGELENFLREFVTSISDEEEPIDENLMTELKKAFMDAYDNNRDGRIDIRELAQLLPIEESFKLVFNFENKVDSSVEFMRIWTKYDTDSSGAIDSNELKNFLRDLITRNQEICRELAKNQRKLANIGEEKLEEYTQTLLQIFDSNKDGKLQLSEMTKMLLVKENFLRCSGIFDKSSNKLDKAAIERIFQSYDTDRNGVIENEELKGFIKDLMDFLGKVPDSKELEEFERVVMEGCDSNSDGKINKKELTTVLLALAKHSADQEAAAAAATASSASTTSDAKEQAGGKPIAGSKD